MMVWKFQWKRPKQKAGLADSRDVQLECGLQERTCEYSDFTKTENFFSRRETMCVSRKTPQSYNAASQLLPFPNTKQVKFSLSMP
jgi:hypothetical protein